MSDKLPALNNLATPALTDLLYIVTPGIDPLGSFNITVEDLQAFLLAGVPRVIERNFTSTPTSVAGPVVMHTFDVPAGLMQDEDILEIEYGGLVATNANNKFISNTVGGNTIENASGGSLTGPGLFGWKMYVRVIRLSDVLVQCSTDTLMGFLSVSTANVVTTAGLGFASFNRQNASVAVADLDTNNLTLQCLGAGGAAGDVTQNLSIIKYIPS
jgi:hypothetical protein